LSIIQIGVRVSLQSLDDTALEKVERMAKQQKTALENQMRSKILSYWGFSSPLDVSVQFDFFRCPEIDSKKPENNNKIEVQNEE